MTAVDNTGTVLYHFLRALSVRVSRSTVHRLLHTPVGSSMRGISDALDALHVKNAVYQLPPTAEYLAQLEAPFITLLQTERNPFCVVTKNAGSIVEFHGSEGKKRTVPTDDFLKQWSGNTLLAETTQETTAEPFCFWKDVLSCLLKYKAIIALLLLLASGLSSAFRHGVSPVSIAYLCTLAFGMLVSVAILYKELFNEHFMERFCHIGKAVDCNEVLHSKGATVAGVGLGELSLLYFGVLFLHAVICLDAFYVLSVVCSLAALCFTVYSVIYQSLVIRKGCLLCMLVNLVVWCIAAELWLLRAEHAFTLSFYSLYMFITAGIVCIAIGIVFKSHQAGCQEKYLLKERLSGLLKPAVFRRLLELEPQVEAGSVVANIAMNNPLQGDKRLLLVTNPNCRNCAKVHPYFKALSANVPMSLVLIFTDKAGKATCGTIIAAYLQDGWDKAMQLLEEWFERHAIEEAGKYPVTDAAKETMKEQVMYCWKQGINRTPSVIVDGHYVPEVYSFSDLRYVLT